MEELGRYYTDNLFSKLLINNIENQNPTNILELGVGEGSLIKAAYERWFDASYYVADIDNNSLAKVQQELPFVKSFHFDSIKEDISTKLKINSGSIDIAVCNPPYLKLKNDLSYAKIFLDAGLEGCTKLKNLTTDIVFLAKNLQILKETGELGIILPDGLITGKEFEVLRQSILQNHSLKAVIQLPENIFKKTEALTHILIIEKRRSTRTSTPLFLANTFGEIVDQIDVAQSSLTERMDYKYHTWSKKLSAVKPNDLSNKFLKDLNPEIKRGNLTHKDLLNAGVSFIHTTNLPHRNSEMQVGKNQFDETKIRYAKAGDILLSRVGCIGKISMVKSGKIPITDCIYRIRIPANYRKIVWASMISLSGKEWFAAHSHGVCAKVISKADLFNFPLQGSNI